LPYTAKAADGAGSIGLLGMQQVAAMPNVRRVLESGRLFELMANLFQDPEVVTSDFKWLRAVAPGEFTGVHTDRVFLGKGSSRLLTAWIPLGDCPVEEGSMMVVPGSHRMEEFSALRSSYGNSEVRGSTLLSSPSHGLAARVILHGASAGESPGKEPLCPRPELHARSGRTGRGAVG